MIQSSVKRIQANKKNSRFTADLMLLLAVIFWAIGMPVAKLAMNDWGEHHKFFFLASRFWLAAIVFTIWAVTRYSPRQFKDHIKPSLVTGLVLAVVFGFLFSAIYLNPAGKVALTMALSSVMVPMGLWVFFKKRILTGIWIGLIIATIGGILVKYGSSSTLIGELLTLISAAAYAIYIILLSYFLKQKEPASVNEKKVDGMETASKVEQKDKYDKRLFLTIQFIVVAVVTSILSLVIEIPQSGLPSWSNGGVFGIIFMAIVATAGAISIQTVYQTETTPERAALVFTLEAPLSVFFAYLLLPGESLTVTMIAGGALIFLGVSVAEILAAREERLQRESQDKSESPIPSGEPEVEGALRSGIELAEKDPVQIKVVDGKNRTNGSELPDISSAERMAPVLPDGTVSKQSSISHLSEGD